MRGCKTDYNRIELTWRQRINRIMNIQTGTMTTNLIDNQRSIARILINKLIDIGRILLVKHIPYIDLLRLELNTRNRANIIRRL